ncbi:MAG: hypothetical protein QOE70_486 [Chthoniobacter sp.]|nr:hypothetical protein [Chthoniobacter sp.]
MLAVFVESHGLVAPGRDRGPTLMVAIWPDGRIVWSRDQLNGGAPFLTARVELRQVAALIERAEGDRVFEAGSFRHSWFGPDSAFTTIWVRSGNRHTRLQSWHEGFEQRPTLVALSSGVTSLAGRTREEALRSDTKEYQHFRRLWGDLRASIAALVPKQGTPYIEATKLDLPK